MPRPKKKVVVAEVDSSAIDESIVETAEEIVHAVGEKPKRGRKTTKTTSKPSGDFGSALDKFLGKAYPNSLITQLKDTTFMDTGLPDFNFFLSGRPRTGGIPLNGKITTFYGPEGCLDKDSFILYATYNKTLNRITNKKGGTIKHLYERFHNIAKDGRSNKINREDIEFYIMSIDEKTNRLIRQPIADVVKTGFKDGFEIKTSSDIIRKKLGKTLRSTKDHKYYIGNGQFKSLEELQIGDLIYVQNDVKNINNIIPDEIVSITPIGQIETYDIKCFAPNNNYIANGIVVHNSGKTSMIARLLKVAIEQGVLPVFLDTERALEKRRFAQLGIEWSKIKHLWPTCIEEAFDIVEKISELAIAHNVNDKGVLIVYDSLAGTLTSDENERKMDQVEIASAAKVINRDMKKIKRIIEKANVGLVLIQQSRINMQVIGHADKYSLPGGQGLKHNSDVLVRIAKGKQDIEGQIVKISTPVKNRLFKPRQSIEAYFDYMNGFTLKQSLANFAKIMVDIGYMKKAGAYCYFANEPDDKFYAKELYERLQGIDELNQLTEDVENYIDANFLEINRLIGQEEIEDPEHLNEIEESSSKNDDEEDSED